MAENKRKKRKPYHLLSVVGKRNRLTEKEAEEELTFVSKVVPAETNIQFDTREPSTSSLAPINKSVSKSNDSGSDVSDSTPNVGVSYDMAVPNFDSTSCSSNSPGQELGLPVESDEVMVPDENLTHLPLYDSSSDVSSRSSSDSDVSELQLCSDSLKEPVTTGSIIVQKFLKAWSIENNITLSSLSSLCKGLKENHPGCFSDLPVDGRTILKTPQNLHTEDIASGQYIHIGLVKQLTSIMSKLESLNVKILELDLFFNIDGLPLFRSSTSELYPILFSLPTIPLLRNEVFPVGLYFGAKKPTDLFAFLARFLEELKSLISNGFVYKNYTVKVNCLGFCCDVPAKSFILGTVSHTGYYSCTRCTVAGETVENRRVFLETNCLPRTHDDFVKRKDKKFQLRETPLIEIPDLNFTRSFCLDYMHLICLGVMRTLLSIWCSGPLPLRLSPSQRKLISENLLMLRSFVPNDFVRKPREVNQLKTWKATEFRSFLLYFGPVIMKKLLDEEKFNNFLSLNIATTILLNPKLCKNLHMLNHAHELLVYFVGSVETLYGSMYVTHNFHSLIHLVDDIRHFSYFIPNVTLDSISAFPFENFLQQIKKKVRGRAKPLQQIGRRLAEEFSSIGISSSCVDTDLPKTYPCFEKKHTDGPLPLFCCNPQYKKVQFELFSISTLPPNNCCRMKNGSVVLVDNFAFSRTLNQQVVVGKKFLNKENLYSDPFCPSSDLGIFKVSRPSNRKTWNVNMIEAKCMYLQFEEKSIVLPLLHCEI